MLMTKSSAPPGSTHSSLDTAYAESRAFPGFQYRQDRLDWGHLTLHGSQPSYDRLLITLKHFLSGCLISLSGSQTGFSTVPELDECIELTYYIF